MRFTGVRDGRTVTVARVFEDRTLAPVAEVAEPGNCHGVAISPDATLRDALAESVMTWFAAICRTIVQCRDNGDLRTDADESQFLFEIHGLILALHYEARFLRAQGALQRALQGFENILLRYSAPVSQSNS